MKAIINMTTAFLLLLMFLFGWSLVTYNENPEKYQWLDANGEFKTSSYDLTVSYNLDTPLDELNGYSLKEVFEEEQLMINNLFDNDLSNWGIQLNASAVVNNGIVELTATQRYSAILQQTNPKQPNGDEIFLLAYANLANGNQEVYINDGTGQTTVAKSYGDWDYHYGRRTQALGSNKTRVVFQDNNVSNWETWYIDYVYLLNLTDLGIENLTDDEIFYWYSEYQRLQENQIENYKELGVTVESSWQFLVGYFNELGDVIQGQVNFVLDTLDFISGVTQNIITVPIFG